MLRSIFAAAAATFATSQLTLTLDTTTAAYSVFLDGVAWLNSDVYAARHNGNLFTSGPGGGLSLQSAAPISGTGVFGPYTGYSVQWTIPTEGNQPFETNAYIYASSSAIVFEQSFPQGLFNTNISANTGSDAYDVITSFPSFGPSLTSLNTDLGYMAWADCMNPGHVNVWKASGIFKSHFGSNGGATILFNSTRSAIAMGSLSDVMTSHFTFADSLNNVFANGLSGRVNSVPAGWKHSSILVGGLGVNDTMWQFGERLLEFGGKTRTAVLDDFQTSYLSYWTDNGAYYYYCAGSPCTQNNSLAGYESTMQAVKAYETVTLGLPVRTFQYDSWWYFKEGGEYGKGAVLLWEPLPIVFPDGFSNWLGLPVALHNRYFARQNNYSSQYTFVTDAGSNPDDFALPVDENMFKHIMGKAITGWDMTMYEQDWLITTYQSMAVTQTNISVALTWLHAMGSAATSLNITIQYCMPLPNHMLASTAIQPVTNARASGDYHPGADNWAIGLSSILYQSIGIQPSKDDWWTSEVQPGAPYGDHPSEPNWQLQAIITTLSTGPVGISDMIGATNATLVLSTCRPGDGLLLRPDRPATTLDSAIVSVLATPPSNANDFSVPDVYHTFSAHGHKDAPVQDGAGIRWHYIIATRLSSNFSVAWLDIGLTGGVTAFVTVDYFNPMAPVGSVYGTLAPSSPINIPHGQGQPGAPTNAHSIRYMTLAPILPGTGGWVLLGEQGKIAAMSKQRSSGLTLTPSGFTLNVHASGPGGARASVGGVHGHGMEEDGSLRLAEGVLALPRAVEVSENMRARGLAPVHVPGETNVTYMVSPPTGSLAARSMLGENAAEGAVALVTCAVTGGGTFALACDSNSGCTCK